MLFGTSTVAVFTVTFPYASVHVIVIVYERKNAWSDFDSDVDERAALCVDVHAWRFERKTGRTLPAANRVEQLRVDLRAGLCARVLLRREHGIPRDGLRGEVG